MPTIDKYALLCYMGHMFREEYIAAFIRRNAYKEVGEGECFILSSGLTSKFYIDKYEFLCDPMVSRLVENGMWNKVEELGWYDWGNRIDCICGVELGGAILASAIASRHHLSFGVARKRERIQGELIQGRINPGDKVLLVEDIVTTGTQVVEAVGNLNDFGCRDIRVLSVVDRKMGGREALENIDVEYKSLLTIDDIMKVKVEDEEDQDLSHGD